MLSREIMEVECCFTWLVLGFRVVQGCPALFTCTNLQAYARVEDEGGFMARARV